MTFLNIRFTNASLVIRDDADRPRQFLHMTVHLNEQQAEALEEYAERFRLKDATWDMMLSRVFRLGLAEIKAQTELDRWMDEHDPDPGKVDA